MVRLLENGALEDLAEGALPPGGRYGRHLCCADIIGDFRENIVTIDDERHRLMLLANPTVARRHGYWPYTDFDYRHNRSRHASSYYIYVSPPDTSVTQSFSNIGKICC